MEEETECTDALDEGDFVFFFVPAIVVCSLEYAESLNAIHKRG
jgi:hypothetical protein